MVRWWYHIIRNMSPAGVMRYDTTERVNHHISAGAVPSNVLLHPCPQLWTMIAYIWLLLWQYTTVTVYSPEYSSSVSSSSVSSVRRYSVWSLVSKKCARLGRWEECQGTPRHYAEERKRQTHQQAYMDVNKWPTRYNLTARKTLDYAVFPRREPQGAAALSVKHGYRGQEETGGTR